MGALLSAAISQSFPPKPTFAVTDIPDLTGKVVVVTGGNSGIGKETVKALLQHNAKVYIAARSPEKAKEAIKDLQTETGKEAHFLKLDLADLHSVKAAADEFNQKETKLNILFNNGGVMVRMLQHLIIPPVAQVTAQNYDLQFGTNVLGHFYFTKLLIPALLAAHAADKDARVVNTSSLGHMNGGIDFNTLKDGPARKKLSSSTLYSQSKFGNVVFAMELSRRYPDQLVSTSLNPGNLKTELQRHVPGLVRKTMNMLLYPASYGALTQLWAGTTAEGATLSGKYLIPWARVGSARAPALDPAIGKELWTWLEEQVENI